MTDQIWLWVGFNLFVPAMLALDLGVFHCKTYVVTIKESLTWTAVWVSLALLVNLGIWQYMGQQKELEFFTGYVKEKSLSVDNVFVFALLFSYFAVPPLYQHKVLFWGILVSLAMRAIMIFLGAAPIAHFAWIIYVFGAFLILTGIKKIVKLEEELLPERNPLVRWFKKPMPVTKDYRGDRFFVRENGILMATPLFVVLLMVEFSDVIFAVTKDPFIVYTSNVFVGVKMLLGHTTWKIDTPASLGVIVGVLAIPVILSLLRPRTVAVTADLVLPVPPDHS